MELVLDRKLAEKRVFLAMDINKSGTKRGTSSSKDVIRDVILRKLLHPLNTLDAMEFLLNKLEKTKSNVDFLDSMNAISRKGLYYYFQNHILILKCF